MLNLKVNTSNKNSNGLIVDRLRKPSLLIFEGRCKKLGSHWPVFTVNFGTKKALPSLREKNDKMRILPGESFFGDTV